jgi:hypothetical protein
MKLTRIMFLLLLTIIVIPGKNTVYAHGLIYHTEELADNKIRITLKWSDYKEAKGIAITYFHLKNGKTLDIGYEIKEGASTTTYLDYSLAGAVPPIRIILTDINSVNKAPFDDIEGIEAFEYIKHLHDAGIIQGRSGNLFSPKAHITRAEFMTLMVKALKMPVSSFSTYSFKDIEKHWAKDIIQTANKNGLISGYEDGTIRPDNPITVAEVCAVISRSFKFKTTFNGIYDKLKPNKWYSDKVKRIFDVGILSTYDSIYLKFNEESYINRANCALMVSRALSTY